jgi:hypothetical protein
LDFSAVRQEEYAMKENDKDWYLGLMGIAPEPKRSLSTLPGLDPPPVSPVPPIPSAYRTLSDLMRGTIPVASAMPVPEFTAPPISPYRSLRDMLGTPEAQPVVPAPTGIRFQDAYFSEPKPLFSEWLPMQPGLYAVLVFDFSCEPRPYRPIYFGKAEDLAKRVTSSHEKYSEWSRACKSVTGLYLAYHAMPNSSDLERGALERNLIRAFTPQCNDAHNPLSDAFGF